MVLAQLIPETLFEGMHMGLLWGAAAVAIAVLVFGADRAVSAAVRLAKALGMPTIVIGATVVSLGTTTPEACISVSAAWRGEPGLALGNAVGSIICDTALVFGLCCCLVRLPKDRFILRRHGWLKVGSGTLLTVIALVMWWVSGDITKVFLPRLIGLGLLVLLVVYMYLSVRWARQHPQLIPAEAAAEVDREHPWRVTATSLAVLLFGLALVVGGSELLIGSVKEICHRYEVPKEVLAVTLVAFGTSLPELVTAIAAIAKGQRDLLVGNIIGADILNVLFVVGASSAAVELKVEPSFFKLYLPLMMASIVLLGIYIAGRGSTFKRWQGVPLLGLYVLFCILTVKYGGQLG